MEVLGTKIRDDIVAYAKVAHVGYVSGQLELTSACEQKCPQCSSWIAHRKGTMQGTWSLRQVQDLFLALAALPTFEHLSLTGGDPQSWGPLYELFEWWRQVEQLGGKFPFKLQVSTAGMLPFHRADLWRSVVQDLRLSLDAVEPEPYRKMRGVDADPMEILERVLALKHPRLATITTVSEATIDHVPAVVRQLRIVRPHLRKAMFLPVLGVPHTPYFWEQWGLLSQEYADEKWLGFSDQNPLAEEGRIARKFASVRCWVGSMSFHAKANGDWYPCCLVGGEALATQKSFCLGNVHVEGYDLELLRKRYVPLAHYADSESICSKICQYKQLQVNIAAEHAEQLTLAMP